MFWWWLCLGRYLFWIFIVHSTVGSIKLWKRKTTPTQSYLMYTAHLLFFKPIKTIKHHKLSLTIIFLFHSIMGTKVPLAGFQCKLILIAQNCEPSNFLAIPRNTKTVPCNSVQFRAMEFRLETPGTAVQKNKQIN